MADVTTNNLAGQSGEVVAEKKATLWVANIEPWMSESWLCGVFSANNRQVLNVRIVRDHDTKAVLGYAFLSFKDTGHAQAVIDECQEGLFHAPDGKRLKVNWALRASGQSGPAVSTSQKPTQSASIYVGNLCTTVGDSELTDYFVKTCKSVKLAKVITNSITGASKGYGFVVFSDHQEAKALLTDDATTHHLHGRSLVLRVANKQRGTDKNHAPHNNQQEAAPAEGSYGAANQTPSMPGFSREGATRHAAAQAAAVAAALVNPPAITNLTSTQAQLQAWSLVGGAQNSRAEEQVFDESISPGLAHFQALLQHPLFVQAFEDELQKVNSALDKKEPSDGWPEVLTDRPECFGKRKSLAQANEEFIAATSIDDELEGMFVF